MHLIWYQLLALATVVFFALYLVVITLLVKLYRSDRVSPTTLFCLTDREERPERKKSISIGNRNSNKIKVERR